MMLKTLLAAAALALTPVLVNAQCSRSDHVVSKCAIGELWDSASESCVKLTSS